MDMTTEVATTLEEWARASACTVERYPAYWMLRPAAGLDGGTISVIFRANEHGPIEVAPSNDVGWFERYGCGVSGLRATLDLSLGCLREWVGREDPYQGLP